VPVHAERTASGADWRSIVARDTMSSVQRLAHELADAVEQQASNVEGCDRELERLISEAPTEEARVREVVHEVLDTNATLREQINLAVDNLNRQTQEMEDFLAADAADPVTGLTNRESFERELARRSPLWTHHATSYSVLLLEIDNFEQIERQRGTDRANEVLRAAAGFLTEITRESDLVGYYDVAVFAIALPAVRIPTALKAAERLRSAFAGSCLATDADPIQLTVSIGAAETLADMPVDVVIRQARLALFEARSQGGNRCRGHVETRQIAIAEPMAASLPA
jgi:diguanylate cyclase